ncbi:MAG: hypothetical protein WCX73_00210 [Candidatus Pacearchaeota archaeon]|jgi:hypothetical protein
MQKKVTLSFDDRIYEKFQKFCQENGLMLSRKIEIEMENLMKKEKGEKK